MAYATWWSGDTLPALAPLPHFSATRTDNAALLARLADLPLTVVHTRLSQGHRPYVARLAGQPVAYGWVATHTAHIGELDVTLTLPDDDRYLWDFATLPDWRGRGLYPHLLQAILRAEAAEAERFWIIAAPENRASAAGIAKAGFATVALLSFQRDGRPGLVALGEPDRAVAAGRVLQVPLLDTRASTALSPCWHCAIVARQDGQPLDDLGCWPSVAPGDVALIPCTCG